MAEPFGIHVDVPELPSTCDIQVRRLTSQGHGVSCVDGFGASISLLADPGIGFGKSARGCLELLGRLDGLETLERPVLVGASRKSFLGRAFGHEGEDRLMGSAVTAGMAVGQGASIVRAHDVRATRIAVDVAAGIRQATRGEQQQ